MTKLFDKLVPSSGQADTIEGEMVRAINRIWYRYENDGDFFFKGYGLETCMSSVKYLLKSPVGNSVRPLFLSMQNETRTLVRGKNYDFAAQYTNKDPYLQGLKKIATVIINYVNSKKGKLTPNQESSR